MAIAKSIRAIESGDFLLFFMISPFHRVSDRLIFMAIFCRLQVGYLEIGGYVNDFPDVPGVLEFVDLSVYWCYNGISGMVLDL